MLRVWIEGSGRLLFFKAFVLRIFDDADDFDVLPLDLLSVFPGIACKVEGAAQGRLSSKVIFGQGFVDDGYPLRRNRILRKQAATEHNRHAHHIEIARSDNVVEYLGIVVALRPSRN